MRCRLEKIICMYTLVGSAQRTKQELLIAVEGSLPACLLRNEQEYFPLRLRNSFYLRAALSLLRSPALYDVYKDLRVLR